MDLTPDIVEARALENYYIYLKFTTGEEKIYNMKESISKLKFYNKLKDKEYFKNLKIRGDTIEWQGGEDVAPEKLYFESMDISEYK